MQHSFLHSLASRLRSPGSNGRPYCTLKITSAPASTDSSIRYAAYATRIRTALLSAQRYVAYTSDIGESFRPVAHPNLIRTAYGISWAYLVGDVAHEGYKAYCQNQRIMHPDLPRVAAHERYNDAKSDLKTVADDAGVSLEARKVTPLEDYRTVMVQRALFQGIASMVSFLGCCLTDSASLSPLSPTHILTLCIGFARLHNPFDRKIFWESTEKLQKYENQVIWTYWFGLGGCTSTSIFVR